METLQPFFYRPWKSNLKGSSRPRSRCISKVLKCIEAELVDIRLADAWRAISRVRKRLGENQGTKAALERAAFESDDALVYLDLANNFSDPTSPEHELYLMKAASFGIVEAIEKLGSYYKDKLQDKLKDLLPGSQIESKGLKRAKLLSGLV